MPYKIVNSISIIGCGWLGLPLALQLKKLGFKVSGTVRDLAKTEEYGHLDISFFQLDLSHNILPEPGSVFWHSEIFILTIPPSDPANYCDGIIKILEILEKQPRKISIIYTSSTGVYGKAMGLIDETFPPNPDRAGAEAVLACEKLLLDKKDIFDICILRLAGLVGPGRTPGRFFAAKKNLRSGSSAVNLVHIDDCIGIIVRLIDKEIKNGIYNVCADLHPTHRSFYPAQAKRLGLESPEYTDDSPEIDLKIIDNTLLKKTLDYIYLHPDPMIF